MTDPLPSQRGDKDNLERIRKKIAYVKKIHADFLRALDELRKEDNEITKQAVKQADEKRLNELFQVLDKI